jgi:hypothetical protein
MDLPKFSASEQGANVAPGADPRLQPTPDYGTLGPGTDVKGGGGDPARDAQRDAQQRAALKSVQTLAAVIGMCTALFVVALRSGNVPWSAFVSQRSRERKISRSAQGQRELDGMGPQKEAEALLEQAVRHSAVAVDQISMRVDGWQGQVQWSPQIASLATAALNSDDIRVRESGVEVELAAYGVSKNLTGLEYVLKMVDSGDHAQKVWALWAAGLLANRGVAPDRVLAVLTDHLKDEDVDSRRWAVEALALTGSDASIEPLLKTMHDDPSPAVRERAACGIAASGLFTPEQRMTAVPQLLNYADDPSLDAQTHAWAYQALGDITHQRFGKDSGAWREWYERQAGGR